VGIESDSCSELSGRWDPDAGQFLAAQEDCLAPALSYRRRSAKKTWNDFFGYCQGVDFSPLIECHVCPLSDPTVEFYGRGLFTGPDLHDSQLARFVERFPSSSVRKVTNFASLVLILYGTFMEHSFTWVSVIPGFSALPGHLATSLIVAAIVVVFTLLARRQLDAAEDPAIPDGSLSLRSIAELLVEGVAGMAEGTIGHHWRKYINLYGSFFVFILFANLIGLVPGFAPPTANFNVTFALGLVSFIAYNFVAFKEQGLAYLKHFAGPLLILAPLMVPIEIISNCVRPLSLGLRLLGNMTGDHLTIEIFTGITKVIIPVVFYLLGAFVCVLQAFVFTLLSMVYVSNVLGHGDHH